MKNGKLFDLEIFIVKMKYTDTTRPLKVKIRLVYSKGNVCKIQKTISCNARM